MMGVSVADAPCAARACGAQQQRALLAAAWLAHQTARLLPVPQQKTRCPPRQWPPQPRRPRSPARPPPPPKQPRLRRRQRRPPGPRQPPPPTTTTPALSCRRPAASTRAARARSSSSCTVRYMLYGGPPFALACLVLVVVRCAATRRSLHCITPTTYQRRPSTPAGKRADEPGLREAVAALRSRGHQIAVRCTFDAGDVDSFVGEALQLHDWGGRRALTFVAGGALSKQAGAFRGSGRMVDGCCGALLDPPFSSSEPVLPLLLTPSQNNQQTQAATALSTRSRARCCAAARRAAPASRCCRSAPPTTLRRRSASRWCEPQPPCIAPLLDAPKRNLSPACAPAAGLLCTRSLLLAQRLDCSHSTHHYTTLYTHTHITQSSSSSQTQDPLTALALALDPTAPRAVDVGAVNGHAFLNVALVRLWATHCGLCRACRTRNSPLHPLKTTHNNCAAEQAGGVSAVPEEELSSPLKRLLGPLGIALHGAARVCVAG